MPPKLLLKFETAVLKEIPIQEDKTVISIGRKDDNDIVIDNPAVSSHHCRIVKQGDSYVVEDLNSTNGTFIEGKKILKAELKNKLQFDVVKHSIVFINEDEPHVPAAASIPASHKQPVPQNMVSSAMIPPVTTGPIGIIKVIEGIVEKEEITLDNINTYIGTKESALIKIKTGGLFSGAAESVAVINRRPEGNYIFKVVQAGYPKVNNIAVKDMVELKEGDVIEAGKTKMVFFMKEKG